MQPAARGIPQHEILRGDSALLLPENPYDYFNPVRDRRRLVGRDRELRMARECLDAATHGRPIQIALVGRRNTGKTSLLNEIDRLASERSLLAVRVDLTHETALTLAGFFRAVFDATVLALRNAGLAEQSTEYQAWLTQISSVDSRADEPLLLSHMAMQVNPALLEEDCRRLARLAERQGRVGITLLCDEADPLVQRTELLVVLRNILQAVPSWQVVLAGTAELALELEEVFSPLPRQFEFITVDRFEQLETVTRCVYAPLAPDTAARLAIPIETLEDIAALTRGEPYEINLVCHFIWRALANGDQERFALSPEVLDGVLAELKKLSDLRSDDLAVTESAIELYRRLDADEMQLVSAAAAFERMTVREIAMVLAFGHGYSETTVELPLIEPAELDEAERRINGVVNRLETLGLAKISEGRFQFIGGDFPRTYFKYLAARNTEVPAARRGFGWAGSFLGYMSVLLRHSSSRVLSASADTVSVAGYTHRITLAASDEAGARLARVAAALEGGQPPAAIRLGLTAAFSDLAQVESAVVGGAAFVGFALTDILDEAGEVEGDTVDTGGVFAFAIPDRKAANEQLTVFFERNAEPLARLRIHVSHATVASVAPAAAQRLAILLAPNALTRRIGELFAGDRLSEAIAVVDGAIELWTAEEMAVIAPEKEGQLADLYNRAGFLRAVGEEFDEARECLRQALSLSPRMWLARYNEVYIAARRGEWAVVPELLQRLRRADVSGVGGPVMLVYFPTPASWEKPGRLWNVVTLEQEDLERFLALQAVVVEAAAGGSLEPVVSSYRTQPPVAHSVQHRLAAWALLTLGDQREQAVQAFERACRARGATESARAELQYAQALADDGE